MNDHDRPNAMIVPPAVPPIIETFSPAGLPPPPPRPWGFWATLGFTALILIGFLLAEAVPLVMWVIAAMIFHRGGLPKGFETNGLYVSLATFVATPVSVGLAVLFAKLRRGMRVAEYLALHPVRWRTAFCWGLVLLPMIGVSDGLTALLGRPIVPEFMRQI